MISITASGTLAVSVRACAAKKSNQERGSIYMVFEYMDHDLTGLMERRNYKFQASHVRPVCTCPVSGCRCHLVQHSALCRPDSWPTASERTESQSARRLCMGVQVRSYTPQDFDVTATPCVQHSLGTGPRRGHHQPCTHLTRSIAQSSLHQVSILDVHLYVTCGWAGHAP